MELFRLRAKVNRWRMQLNEVALWAIRFCRAQRIRGKETQASEPT